MSKKYCVISMIMANCFNIGCLVSVCYLMTLLTETHGTLCSNGVTCPDDKDCCNGQATQQPSVTTKVTEDFASLFSTEGAESRQAVQDDLHWWSLWPTYILIIIFTGMFVGCFWCTWHCFKQKHISCVCACCLRQRVTFSDRDSAGSCCPPPRYSRCSSLYRMPPPYSEVTSKPDLYPPVPIYRSNKPDYTVRYSKYQRTKTGSLSATSTAESLNSDCTCNASNEANSIIPPPYSFATNNDTWRPPRQSRRPNILRSLSSLTNDSVTYRHPSRPFPPPRCMQISPDSPAQHYRYDMELELNDYDDMGCNSLIGSCHPRLGNSPSNESPSSIDTRMFDLEILRRFFITTSPDTPCTSPPLPTSPTQFQIPKHFPSQPLQGRRYEYKRKVGGFCRASLYMSLSKGPSTRSAPATPSVFGPTVSTSLPQRPMCTSRSSRLDEENNPLLENNQPVEDDKF